MQMKYYNDKGEVAVLYSHGYGAGWSTWADEDKQQRMMFDPELVIIMLHTGDVNVRTAKLKVKLEEWWGEDAPYAGGAGDLRIAWLKPGSVFRINEYDGAESVILLEETKTFTA